MKTFARKSATALTLILALAASSFNANAQEDKLVYERSSNPSIGITVDNAVGATYTIKDEKGGVVYSGKVKSTQTFYIPCSKLGVGTFHFYIGSLAIQAFQIK